MPEHLRALVFLILIAAPIFFFARKLAAPVMGEEMFSRLRNGWFCVTLISYLAHNVWLYMIGASLFAYFYLKRETKKMPFFLIFVTAVPAFTINIGGFGPINHILDMNHLRLMSIAILYPAYMQLKRDPESLKFGKTFTDKMLWGFMVLSTILFSRDTSLTNFFKQSIYTFIEIFLPYYVASRSLRNLNDFRIMLMAFSLAAFLQAGVGIFEFFKHWLLYPSLPWALGLDWSLASYVMRDGVVRAVGSTGQSLALGFLMAISIGFYLYVIEIKIIKSYLVRYFGLILLIGGLISPLSRGPWLGTVLILLIFVVTGKHAVRRLISLVLATSVALTLISISPGGDTVMNMLPFIGKIDASNVDYRKDLMSNAIPVIERNLFFGSPHYENNPEMQMMVQGQGIIDVVNSYLFIALEFGLTGLLLFVLVFLSALWGVLSAMRKLKDKDSEQYLIGRVLLSTIVSIMVMIVAISSITIIPIIYWFVIAVAVAYVRMVRHQTYLAV